MPQAGRIALSRGEICLACVDPQPKVAQCSFQARHDGGWGVPQSLQRTARRFRKVLPQMGQCPPSRSSFIAAPPPRVPTMSETISTVAAQVRGGRR